MKVVYGIVALVIVVIASTFFFKGDTPVEQEVADSIVPTDSAEVVTQREKLEPLVRSALAEPIAVVPSVAPGEVSLEDVIVTDTHGALKEYTSPVDFTHLTGTNILFFKASWCPTCAALYKALVAEQSAIPEGVTIWVVDYDTNKDMRIQYGVTTQHTLVQVDTELNKINLWRGGYSLSEVMSNVK